MYCDGVESARVVLEAASGFVVTSRKKGGGEVDLMKAKCWAEQEKIRALFVAMEMGRANPSQAFGRFAVINLLDAPPHAS